MKSKRVRLYIYRFATWLGAWLICDLLEMLCAAARFVTFRIYNYDSLVFYSWYFDQMPKLRMKLRLTVDDIYPDVLEYDWSMQEEEEQDFMFPS